MIYPILDLSSAICSFLNPNAQHNRRRFLPSELMQLLNEAAIAADKIINNTP